METQKGFAVISTIFIIIILFVGGYYLYTDNMDSSDEQVVDYTKTDFKEEDFSDNNAQRRSGDDVWISCINEIGQHEFKYPSTWSIGETVSGGFLPQTCEEMNNYYQVTLEGTNPGEIITIDFKDEKRRKGTLFDGCGSVEDCLSIYEDEIYKNNLPGRESTMDGEKILWSVSYNRSFYVFHNGRLYNFFYNNPVDSDLLNRFILNFKFLD